LNFARLALAIVLSRLAWFLFFLKLDKNSRVCAFVNFMRLLICLAIPAPANIPLPGLLFLSSAMRVAQQLPKNRF